MDNLILAIIILMLLAFILGLVAGVSMTRPQYPPG
jgi:hypothetical protein